MINATLIKKLEPEYEVDKYGNRVSYNSKRHYHSFYDYPAVICTDGSQYWYKDGKQHRDNDQPACIWREDGADWYRDGRLHRDNGLPAVIYADGHKEWWVDGELIRMDEL
jgi:hypothetical protein